MKFEKSIPILYSKDVAKSIVFYTDKLGFEKNGNGMIRRHLAGLVKVR